MHILVTGHRYELENFESNTGELNQKLQFIHKAPEQPDSTKLVTVDNGTTNEEVLRVLIDRLYYLQGKFPCKENAVAITHIETALLWLEKRTADRKARNVEGKNEK